MMVMLRPAVCCVIVIVACCLWWSADGYPVGDLTMDGLLTGSQMMTVPRRRRQADSNGCTYPGTVALTVVGKVLYTGLYRSGTVRVPTDALAILEISNLFNSITVYGDDGTMTATIAQNALKDLTVTHSDGTSTITLSTDFNFSLTKCPSNNAILYDHVTMVVDLSTCKTASYGGDTTDIAAYTGILQLDPLESSAVTQNGCCTDVLPNILARSPNLGHPSASAVAHSFTCAKSGEGICNGDIGSTIYCEDSRSGRQVVVGMVDSGTCQKGEYVAVIDFTSGTLPGFSQ